MGVAGQGVAGQMVQSAGQAGALGGAGSGGNGALGSSSAANGGAANSGGQGGSVGEAGSASTGSGGGSGTAGVGGSVGPRLIGRFDRSNASAPVCAWSGAAIAVRFKATSIGVTLTESGSNYFEVVIDDQRHSVLATQAGQKKYVLATGLSDAPHDLLLYRRTEASFGETTFNGFDLAPSAYLPSAPAPTRRIEVIGDSISAGYGNEGALPCVFEGKTENQYLSYEALAARALKAELYTAAWSGIGMLRNYGGETVGTMPERYFRTLPNRTNSRWDFSSFVPDAVVINLGTNDFAKGDPAPAFQTAYTKFVTDLRGLYPAARLFLGVGPLLLATDYVKATSYLRGVIATRAAAGDANLRLLEFGSQDQQADGVGCDYHPSLKTHQKMADKMVVALKAELGW